MNPDTITIGHDGELFAINQKGMPVSVAGLVGGTKDLPSKCNHGALQEDNVMAELNIDPAISAQEFVRNTNSVMQELTERLAKYKLSPCIVPSMEFPEDALNNQQAQTFGCMPDYDAWEMVENPPVNLEETNQRYAGGHIHIGVPYYHDPVKIIKLIKHLDLTVGIGLLLKYGFSDRMKAYGKIGAHRPTPYGVEYRTIDNSWLQSDESMAWVFELTKWVASNYKEGGLGLTLHMNKEGLQDCIDEQDRGTLAMIFRQHAPKKFMSFFKGGKKEVLWT